MAHYECKECGTVPHHSFGCMCNAATSGSIRLFEMKQKLESGKEKAGYRFDKKHSKARTAFINTSTKELRAEIARLQRKQKKAEK